jgi:tetratricopeptide (TPR) repeat protein
VPKKKTAVKKPAATKKKAAKPKSAARSLDQTMSRIVQASADGLHNAQELTYEAMEAYQEGDLARVYDLLDRALDLDPECVDALVLSADVDCDDVDEMIQKLQAAVAAGERELGPKFFAEFRGDFWGLLETRPYMRARAMLAEALVEDGRLDEAIGHYAAMLELNPNDNQGLRYYLLGLTLETSRLADAQRVLKQYGNEVSAVFTWGRVLERFLSDDLAGAERALKAARKANPHVELYLSGRKRPPRTSPAFYSPGEESEAVMCVEVLGGAWKEHKAAAAWLKGQGAGK